MITINGIRMREKEGEEGNGRTVSLGAAALSYADIGIGIERRDEAHVVEAIDFDDVVRGVRVGV